MVINPNNGPKNTSDPSGDNGGYCNVYSNPDYIPHGCNRDWTTHLATINKLSNAQTLGYVYSRYGARDAADVKADIAEWAAWDTAPTWTAGQTADISIHGLWFDEIGTDPGNSTAYEDIITYANTTFNDRDNDSDDDRGYTVVLNAGSIPNATYQAELFEMASAVVTQETCYTDDPAASNVTWDCPTPYSPFDYTNLTAGEGLPYNTAYLPQTVIIVHQFVGPPAATIQTLQEQIEGVAGLGVHSTYFTSGSWHQTTLDPATIGNVSSILAAINGAARSVDGYMSWWVRWVPWVCMLLGLQQTWAIFSS